MKFETQEDYEKYFSRLEAFPTQVHVHVQDIGCSNNTNCPLIRPVFWSYLYIRAHVQDVLGIY